MKRQSNSEAEHWWLLASVIVVVGVGVIVVVVVVEDQFCRFAMTSIRALA